MVLEVRPRIDVEPKLKGFVVSRWLPLGLTPRPVGFIPGTERGDGDPVDAHRPKREWDVTGRNPWSRFRLHPTLRRNVGSRSDKDAFARPRADSVKHRGSLGIVSRRYCLRASAISIGCIVPVKLVHLRTDEELSPQ